MEKKNFFIYLSANICASLITYAMLPLVTRVLTPDEYGVFSIFQTLVASTSVFIGVSGKGVLMINLFDKENKKRMPEYVTGVLLISFIMYLVANLVSYIFYLIIDVELALVYFFVAALTAFLSYFVDIRTILYQGMKKPYSYISYQLGLSVLVFFGVYVFLFVLHLGLEGRIYAAILGPVVLSLLAILSLYRSGLLKNLFQVKRGIYKEILQYSIPLFPYSVMGVAFLYVDRWVLASTMSLKDVGIYSLAVQMASPVTMVFAAVGKAYVPWLFKRLSEVKEGNPMSLVRHHLLFGIVVFLFSSVAFICLLFLIRLVLPDTYQIPNDLLLLVFSSVVILGFFQIPNNVIFYYKKTGSISIITGISFVSYIVFLFVLTKPYGLIGVAVSYFLSTVIRLSLALVYSNYIHRKLSSDRSC